MLNNIVNKMKTERAKFSRNLEYLKECSADDHVDYYTELATNEKATSLEIKEAARMLDNISADDEEVTESVEVEKILNSETNLTFEEMVGIQEV